MKVNVQNDKEKIKGDSSQGTLPLIKELAFGFTSAADLRTTAGSFTIDVRLKIRRHWVIRESSHTSSIWRFKFILFPFPFRTTVFCKVIFINFDISVIFLIVISRRFLLFLAWNRVSSSLSEKEQQIVCTFFFFLLCGLLPLFLQFCLFLIPYYLRHIFAYTLFTREIVNRADLSRKWNSSGIFLGRPKILIILTRNWNVLRVHSISRVFSFPNIDMSVLHLFRCKTVDIYAGKWDIHIFVIWIVFLSYILINLMRRYITSNWRRDCWGWDVPSLRRWWLSAILRSAQGRRCFGTAFSCLWLFFSRNRFPLGDMSMSS